MKTTGYKSLRKRAVLRKKIHLKNKCFHVGINLLSTVIFGDQSKFCF